MSTPIIDPAGLSAHAAAVSAADVKLVQDGFGRLELAIASIANADGVSEADRAAALERLAVNANQLARQLPTAESVEAAITAIFGSDTAAPGGALAAPNADLVVELTDAAKAHLGSLPGGSPEAISRSLVAKGILDGTFPVAGDQPQAVAHLTAANAAKDAAEADKTTAETALANANTAHAALVANIKASLRDARVGDGKVVEVSRLNAEAQAALGL